MDAGRTVTFRAVQVMRDTGTAFLCMIGTAQVWVPLTEIRYGSELAQVGDRGDLLMSRWFAQNIGLCRRGAARMAFTPQRRAAGAGHGM